MSEPSGESILTSDQVRMTWVKCLCGSSKELASGITVPGKGCSQTFSPARIAEHKGLIQRMLHELTEPGCVPSAPISLSTACTDRHGRVWGEERHAEKLIQLGMAAGLIARA
jgi:hypothetical protein